MERVRETGFRPRGRGDATRASPSLDLPAAPALKSSPVTEAGEPHGTCHSQPGTEVSQAHSKRSHYSSFRTNNGHEVLGTPTGSGSDKDYEVVT